MAYERPEGLSPCYLSLASPDIPESHIFKWTPRNTQTRFEIKIYASNASTVLRTYGATSSNTEVEIGSVGYSFISGTTYYWTIQTWNGSTASEVSVKAKFLYDRCPASPAVVWNHIPKHGDVVVSDTYFQEIKTNVESVLKDYSGVSNSLITNTRNLFTGKIVPSREDFKTLEEVIDFLSTKLEDYRTVDIDGPVEDSLGISDLEVIRKHIDDITSVRPAAVQDLSISVDAPSMYTVSNLKVVHDGKEDTTAELSWSVGQIAEYSGKFTFVKTSSSKDIRYYRALFSYGTSNNPFVSELFFKKEDITNGTVRTFQTNWAGLYRINTLGLAKQSLQVFAIDQRGNASTGKTVNKTYGSNFKAPLGVKDFQVQVQRAKLGDAAPNPNGSWTNAYIGDNQSTVYKITGAEGRIYFRVRAIDLSGLTTDWIYHSGITFDPLTPPAAPSPSWTSTTSSVKVTWPSAARAEYYQWKMWSSGDETQLTGREFTKSSLTHNREYNFYVRAGNRAGWSKWIGFVTKTKSARVTREKQATRANSYNNKYGGYWEDNNLVYQGEWCEIEGSPNRIISVPVGWCWGNHKGMWIFDHQYWRDTLKGKKIIKTELWIHRSGKAHGYYDDQIPTFWLHDYSSFPSKNPSFFAKHQPGKEFDLGEKAWVTLPNYYAEYLRDGKAKGIGIYRDNWGQLPYIKYHDNAKLRITYE